VIFQAFGNAEQAAAALAAEVAAALRSGIQVRGIAGLAVPGGRTPLPLFHALRRVELPWERVHVTLTDERCVPEGDAASNAALVRRELLQGPAAAANFIPLPAAPSDTGRAATAAWNAIAAAAWPFDAVVLGMGEDGHFASLFPGSPGLAGALDAAARPACVPMRAPAPPAQRVSLNLAALAGTARLFLFVTGESKRRLIGEVARGAKAERWPVAALLVLAHPEVEVYWAP
jgi:6-phosphogluconolactonase